MRSKADAGTEKSPQVYNGTSLCIHLLRQFYASHLYNAWQEDTKYGNILSGIEWSLTAKGTIYCITFALFIFIFLSSCSIALSFPWASSWTVVKQHFTVPSHSWCIDPNTLLLHLGIDKIATEYLCSSKAMSINRQRRKKKHNLSQSEFSRSLHANAKGKCTWTWIT